MHKFNSQKHSDCVLVRSFPFLLNTQDAINIQRLFVGEHQRPGENWKMYFVNAKK